MIQSGEIMTGISDTNNFMNFQFKMANLYLKKLSNIDTKKVNNNSWNIIFIDAELNMIGKTFKEKIGSGITLTNNEIN